MPFLPEARSPSHHPPSSRLITSCKVIALLFHLLLGVSHRHSRLLLAAMRTIMRLTVIFMSSRASSEPVSIPRIPPPSRTPSSTSPPLYEPWREVPKDIRPVVKEFRLDPAIRAFTCCPSCFALYDQARCPPTCTYQETPASMPCGSKLWRKRTIAGREHQYPALEYHHQSLKSWLGRFLCRPGIENQLEKADVSSETPGVWTDFWDGTAIRNLRGPAGHNTLYMDTSTAHPHTLRLVYALTGDSFNPFQSKPGKGSVSTTGLYLVCLNLPPHLRYLPENVYFVGAVPGKPSLQQMNHFLSLIVDDFLPFWQNGVFFSRTAKHDSGRWVNAAIIPLIADLPAARQMAGFGGHNMTFFCSYCHLKLEDMEELDVSRWSSRTYTEHLRHAREWRDAPNTHVRERLFSQTGIRWTELLRLPYWIPFLFTALDSMHNHYLGLVEDHCRNTWGMSLTVEDGDGFNHPTREAPPMPSRDTMQKATHDLIHGTERQLDSYRKAVLWYLCLERGLRRASTKARMIKELLNWVSHS